MKSLLLVTMLIFSSLSFSQTELSPDEGKKVLAAIDYSLRDNNLKCVATKGWFTPNLNLANFNNVYTSPYDNVSVVLNDQQPIVELWFKVLSNSNENIYYSFTSNKEETKILKVEYKTGKFEKVEVNVGTIRNPVIETREEFIVTGSAICE